MAIFPTRLIGREALTVRMLTNAAGNSTLTHSSRQADRKFKRHFGPDVWGSASPESPPPALIIAALYRCLRLQGSELALSGINSHGGWGRARRPSTPAARRRVPL